MSIEVALILIVVLLLMAWSWRYRDGENRRLRDCVDMWRLRCSLLESELGATADAAAQDVDEWR